MKNIIAGGHTVVPALLALEALGFKVTACGYDENPYFRAERDGEAYIADDPIMVLGLVKLIELRSWDWRPTDEEIDVILERYHMG